MRDLYIKNAHAFLLLFSVTDPDSLVDVQELYYPQVQQRHPFAPVYLIANKCDLPSRVNLEAAQEWAAAHHLRFAETSCKALNDTNKVFEGLAEWVIWNRERGEQVRQAVITLICIRKYRGTDTVLGQYPLEITVAIARHVYASRYDDEWNRLEQKKCLIQ
jgi:GTPase SAR1 family protein